MIFLSYNEQDRTSVSYLNQILQKQNFDTWIAHEKLLAGDDLDKKSDSIIGKCSTFVFCIGKHGVSNFQENELALAKKHQKRILPILLPNNEGNINHKILDTYFYIDFRKEFKNQDEISKLFRILNGEVIGLAPKLIEQQELPISNKQTTKKAVSVAIINDLKLLIVQRAQTQKTGHGLWQLPGGKVGQNESTEQGGIREVKEEVGLTIYSNQLKYIGDFLDTWVIDSKDDYIQMSLYVCFISKTPLDINKEFSSYKWLPVQDFFEDKQIIYFGSTSKYLKKIRRYILTHLPLNQIASYISNNLKEPKPLPKKLDGITEDATSVIYSFLSLMGFIADRGDYYPSSTLSHQLIRLLSEWALTDGVIFEAIGNDNSGNTRKNDNPIAVAKFKEGLFEHHSNLLGMLSYKLPKVLSERKVADLLIFGKSKLADEMLLLVRWDFLSNKFQIPSKGLEDIESDIKDIETAKEVVKKRFTTNLSDHFNYIYFTKFETQHIGAGSLSLIEGDGPMLRNYTVSVFKLSPVINKSESINNHIDEINHSTIDFLSSKNTINEIQHNTKRDLNFYMWVSLNHFYLERNTLLGEQFQGLSEILDNVTFDDFLQDATPVEVSQKEFTPIIFSTENSEYDHKSELSNKYAERKN